MRTGEGVQILGDPLLGIVSILGIIWCLGQQKDNQLSRFSAEAEYRGVANVVAESCWL
jgi:hypothetical protein